MFRFIVALSCCSAAFVLTVVNGALAAIVDSQTFTDVLSKSIQSDPANDVFFFTTDATESYTIGAISWDGMATPGEDLDFEPDPQNNPDEIGRYPTFGLDLTVRVTHDQSGNFADVVLGQNGPFGEFGPGPQQFIGSTLNLNGSLLSPGDGATLNGTTVDPGDTFTLEFYEDFDEQTVDPDAVWDSITINLEDNFFAPPASNTIRFDANGFLTAPTQQGGLGSQFYGVTYGESESGLPIASLRLDGHDVKTFRFDLREEVGNIQFGEDGQFRANLLGGVQAPTATFINEDPDEQFADTFGALVLDFEEGDFEPGDSIRFGVLTSSGDFGTGTDGFLLTQLTGGGPLTLSVTFEDGTIVSGALTDLIPGEDFGSFVDIDITQAAAPSGGDTDGDGDIDGDDLLNTLLGFGIRTGALPIDGDADGHGDVDRDDVALLLANFGQMPAGSVATASAVPEPATALLLLPFIGAFTWLAARRRRNPVEFSRFCTNFAPGAHKSYGALRQLIG